MLEILAGFCSEKASCVRQPVQQPMAVAEGNAGKLATTQPGLEIFRKESDHTNPAPAGVAVTTFGQNPDAGTGSVTLWIAPGFCPARRFAWPFAKGADTGERWNFRG
jgi:hypothetical protein